jgi:hypothetical protein
MWQMVSPSLYTARHRFLQFLAISFDLRLLASISPFDPFGYYNNNNNLYWQNKIQYLCTTPDSCARYETCVTEASLKTIWKLVGSKNLYLFFLFTRFGNQLPLINNKPVNNNEAVHTWNTADFVQTLEYHNLGMRQFPGKSLLYVQSHFNQWLIA